MQPEDRFEGDVGRVPRTQGGGAVHPGAVHPAAVHPEAIHPAAIHPEQMSAGK